MIHSFSAAEACRSWVRRGNAAYSTVVSTVIRKRALAMMASTSQRF
ncbi:Uncharacterised protein [Bordetella pertussis]|nr:Uncharacterised protein [Bordetella pertussis]CPL14915.1 Uncharacterised protein [Bordetella pertussis]